MDIKYPEKAPDAAGHNFFYSTLNLNNATSQTEINERHRALSLIFHPDKQQDEKSKIIATQKFLEVQKAYQVLSDPFLREVYDILGEEGLSFKWTADFRAKPQQEVRELLLQLKNKIQYKKLDEQILPRGSLSCAVDASPLFGEYVGSAEDPWPRQIIHRLQDVQILSYQLRHSIQKTLGEKTNISLEPRVHRHGRIGDFTCLGTLRHQFSPRFSSEAVITLLRPHVVSLAGTYRENGNSATVRTSFSPNNLNHPSLTISLSRKLFRRRLELASIELHAGQQPHLTIDFVSPKIFGLRPNDLSQSHIDSSIPLSVSGLKFGTTHKSFGLNFESIVPKLFGEWGVTFSELALQLKLGLELGLSGLAWAFSGSWSNQTTDLKAVAQLSSRGVVVELNITHMEQRLSIPIVLSLEHNTSLLFWVMLVPSTALVLGYRYIIIPRRRMQRLARIRAARQALEEESGVRREREAITSLLKDTARRSQQAETTKGGLVIVEATYGPAERDNVTKDLSIDVTISLQALVRNSQLYLPASQTKSGIQGFSDPAPFTDKELHIRYLFRDQMHYTEIPDGLPTVLPLAEHFVN